MKPVIHRALRQTLGGALAGVCLGLVEALCVLAEGRVQNDHPLVLLLLAASAGAILALPGAWLAPRGLPGAVGFGAASWALAELLLAVVTDPPPFQAAPWWVGNPAPVLGALLLLLGLWWAVKRRPALGWLMAAAGLVLPLSRLSIPPGPEGQAPPEAPNVMVVTLDTTRADRLEPYGAAGVRTPALSGLAQRGVVFEAAFAPIAVTGPSHTSLWSGQGPWSHGVLLNGVPVPEQLALLPDTLRAQGWQGGAFVSAYVLDHKIGLSRGFQVYDDDFSGRDGLDALLPARLWAALTRFRDPELLLERRGDHTVDEALRWLEGQSAERPVFLWVHLFDPHGPYAPPAPFDAGYSGDPRDPAHTSMSQVQNVAPYLRKSLEGITDLSWVLSQYDGEIAFADAQLGRLLHAMDARDDGRGALVVVAGDHGESLGEHGVWFNHGDDLYDPALHIPLVVSWPGHVPEGRRVSEVVELVDVAPTLAGLLGLSWPGESLQRLWEGGAGEAIARGLAFDRVANVAQREAGLITAPKWRLASLRTHSSRFVLREAEGYGDELYVTEGEGFQALTEENLLSQVLGQPGGAEVVMTLRRQAEGLLVGDTARSAVELGEEERRRLEALGYLE